MLIERLIELIKGILFGFGPIVVIFILYKLARGKKGKEIIYNKKEFTKSSFRNFLILIIFIILIIGGVYFYWQFQLANNTPKNRSTYFTDLEASPGYINSPEVNK